MTAPDKTQETRVLYNGDCPICAFEIGHYRKAADAQGAPLRFDDLNGPALAQYRLTPDQAAKRLHAIQDGHLVTGLAAFRAIWSQLPRWRWLAWLTGLPGLRRVIGWAYDQVGAPLLYRAHLRRVARREEQTCSPSSTNSTRP
ncbi:MAG: DUF393 domain-containing protein [Pseudomonadota bacterium]